MTPPTAAELAALRATLGLTTEELGWLLQVPAAWVLLWETPSDGGPRLRPSRIALAWLDVLFRWVVEDDGALWLEDGFDSREQAVASEHEAHLTMRAQLREVVRDEMARGAEGNPARVWLTQFDGTVWSTP